jgi:AbrB family looped-hinge helix DNA binding protein
VINVTTEEPEVTTMSEKGQVVIPQSIRKELGIKPKTKFLVYGRGDTVIMKKLDLPNLKKEWDNIFKSMDKKQLRLSEKEIQEEAASARKARR